MDILREQKPKTKKRTIQIASAVVVLILITWGLSSLKPAAPTVDRATIWTDTVKLKARRKMMWRFVCVACALVLVFGLAASCTDSKGDGGGNGQFKIDDCSKFGSGDFIIDIGCDLKLPCITVGWFRPGVDAKL